MIPLKPTTRTLLAQGQRWRKVSTRVRKIRAKIMRRDRSSLRKMGIAPRHYYGAGLHRARRQSETLGMARRLAWTI